MLHLIYWICTFYLLMLAFSSKHRYTNIQPQSCYMDRMILCRLEITCSCEISDTAYPRIEYNMVKILGYGPGKMETCYKYMSFSSLLWFVSPQLLLWKEPSSWALATLWETSAPNLTEMFSCRTSLWWRASSCPGTHSFIHTLNIWLMCIFKVNSR